MSRIGKQLIQVPQGVTVTISPSDITVTGPLGTLKKNTLDLITISQEDGVLTFTPRKTDKFSRSLWGTYSSQVQNMIQGVVTPFTKKLILEGVGFKSEVKGTDLHLALGFSHPVVVAIPQGLTVTAEKNNITVTGIDKELVGFFTANVRSMKKPEPYKGKGFRYSDEIIRRKAGKKSA